LELGAAQLDLMFGFNELVLAIVIWHPGCC
jgi:hypothetical protein